MNERTTLLLVEDDAAHVELIRRAFEEDKSDINLRVCATLKETRRMSQITPPDLFISDLNLPDGSGLELLASSNGDPQIPVILMTGFGNEDIAVEAMKSGAMDYIVKSEGAFSSMPKTVKRVLREWRYFSENKNINHVLQEVAKGIAAKKHETFFDALVRSLSASLLADKVFIGELVGESQEIGKSIAFGCDGQKGDYFEYPLEGSPCNLHTTQDICTFPSDLQTLFPDCALAKEMGIEAYIGVSIKDHQGIPIGILDQQNYHVIYAESAKQALQILENEPIDLLLSDVIMPEMHGYQLAAIVHRKYPAVKILLTSGFSDNRELDIVDENLQRNMLHKPYNAQTLLQRIGRLLG